VKTVVVAPIPRARVKMANREKTGDLLRLRIPNFTSLRRSPAG